MTNVSRTTDSRQQDCSTLQTIPAASLHHGLGITRTPEKAMLVKSSPQFILYELFTRRTAYAPSKHPQKIHYGDTANENKKKTFSASWYLPIYIDTKGCVVFIVFCCIALERTHALKMQVLVVNWKPELTCSKFWRKDAPMCAVAFANVATRSGGVLVVA